MFNVQKFMEFQMGTGGNHNTCVKCAAAFALGKEPEYYYFGSDENNENNRASKVLYTNLHDLEDKLEVYRLKSKYKKGENWFSKNFGIGFAQKMDIAEDMLWYKKVNPEQVKKFVIDAAMAEGLIKVEEAAHV